MSRHLDGILERTGFRGDAFGDSDGLRRGYDAETPHLEPAFSRRAGLAADAVYETEDGPKLIIKGMADHVPSEEARRRLHERAWNLGLAPLLWIVTPVEVRVYDAYRGVGEASDCGAVGTYRLGVEAEMDALDAFCGRLALDTGAFRTSELGARLDRRGKVDRVLLEEIRALEDRLVGISHAGGDPASLAEARGRCQEIITCTLFASYLLDRGIAAPLLPPGLPADLSVLLGERERALALFTWLHDTFNGDVFPEGIGTGLHEGHLALLRDFVEGTGLTDRGQGQMRLFRFRFDTVPIELISAVYEAFSRRAAADMAKRLGLHYTPVELVHMALDPIFEGLDGDARILDPTCGSGLFLVQSLRRLAWKRCGDGPRPRSTVRDILYRQVHGIDVEPAALRVAAFSLYLAALELETTAGPDEPIRFEPLIGRTLHALDFLSREARTLSAGLGISAVVGNPPWTHGALKGKDDGAADRTAEAEGTRRSPDHRFLTAAIDVVGHDGRIALYLKAAPLLSRSPEASRFRERILRSLGRIAILNLSPLRHEGLFSEAQSPGVLLCANCGNMPPPDSILVGTFPWTPDFARSGSLALSSADVRIVEKARIVAAPSVLKAAMLGTPRDIRAIERIESGFGTLDGLLREAGVRLGQGFQVKGLARNAPKAITQGIDGLPAIFPRDYVPVVLDVAKLASLRERGVDKLLFQRDRSLYRGPLVLFPKSAHRKALQEGRTSAALFPDDIAFSHGFYGLSFGDADPRLATILCAVLNSAIPGYMFLYGAGALGMERPSIQLQDLRQLRMPAPSVTDALARRAAEALAMAGPERCAALDAFAARLYGLDPDERDLVADAVRRGRSTFLDSATGRAHDAGNPDTGEMRRYAGAVCRTVNAVLKVAGRQHLVAAVARSRGDGGDPLDRFAAVRFSVADGRPTPDPVADMSAEDAGRVFGELRGRLVRSPTPYLKELRSVRIYDGAEVTVVKPAQRRYWSVASAMQDGDAILADHAPWRR